MDIQIFLHLFSGLKTRATAAAAQAAPPVTHRQTAAIPPAPLQMTAAVTATMTALPPPHPLLRPPHLRPQTAQTQEVAAIRIKDLLRRRKRRNKHCGISRISCCYFSFPDLYIYFFFFSPSLLKKTTTTTTTEWIWTKERRHDVTKERNKAIPVLLLLVGYFLQFLGLLRIQTLNIQSNECD